ncbi:hypothetical membrane protein [Sphingobium sp. SYK-6]|uniref:hypothetical protein n=1 Tax=Sphingobium sp. (strain NBRC 103272 / SYK-6) TaxID=627192 RepID=UPI000227796B|nr:hypothetical protein [Sphingobium sp. SYK-6]BAK68063.1 hypothetical membrane protein [Sphingobium sp. SYK-6]
MRRSHDNAARPLGVRLRPWLAALDRFAQREWRWIVVIAWLIISAVYLDRYASAIGYLSLGDTDDNMRYLQVRDWLNGQSWWDLRQHRMNPPEGANIHWSRLVDLPIAALMLFFRLFMAPDRADQMALGVAPLIPLLVLMFSLAFITRRLSANGRAHGWFAAMLLPLAANMGLGMYMPLRVDHHGWQLALTAATLAGMVDRKWTRGGLVAGISSAASLVIGMEMMVYLAGAGAIMALRWIFKDGAARRLRPYALGLGGTTAIGYALFASNANRLPVCDALSPVWASTLILASGILLALTMLPLRRWPARLVAASIGGAIVAGFALTMWPQCLTGAYQISPELQSKWLVYIREAKPIYAQARASWVPMIALPISGLLCVLAGCWSARRDTERLWAWGIVGLMTAFAIGLTFWQIRAGPAAQLLAIPPVGWAIWSLVARLGRRGWPGRVAAGITLGLLACLVSAYGLYPIINGALANSGNASPAPAPPPAPATNAGGKAPRAGNATPPPASAAPARNGSTAANAGQTRRQTTRRSEARCRTLPALQVLNQLPPATIFTLVDLGPRLIATTHHSAIAGPYHRNEKAILDIHHAFDGSPENFRAIAAAHGASYLLFCPNFPEGTIYQRRSPRGFYARLSRGEGFTFLDPVTLDFPGELPYTLYRIEPMQPDEDSSAPLRKKGAKKAR